MACGGSAPTPTPTPTPPFCGLAYLFIDPPTPQYLEITVGGLGFVPDRLEVAASIKEIEPGMANPLEIREVVLCFSNVSTISQHNLVMVRDGTKDAVIKRENTWRICWLLICQVQSEQARWMVFVRLQAKYALTASTHSGG